MTYLDDIARLIEALEPLARLGGPIDGTPAFHDLEDDVIVYRNSEAAITAGDVREARRVWLEYTSD